MQIFIEKYTMKSFIQKALRLLLEAGPSLERSSPSNPIGSPDPKVMTKNDLYRITAKIANLYTKYGSDPYFQNTHDGDGIYFITIHTNGEATVKTPNRK